MFRHDTILRSLRRLGRRVRRLADAATRQLHGNPIDAPSMLQPALIPIPVRRTRRR